MRTSPSGVYPAGGLRWCFTCSFDFRHSVRLPFVPAFAFLGGGEGDGGNHPCSVVPVGTVGPFSPGVALSGGGEWRGRGLARCVQHASLSELCPAGKFQ